MRWVTVHKTNGVTDAGGSAGPEKCPGCEKNLKRTCPAFGKAVEGNWKACPACGTGIDAGQPRNV